jgi:hypothetical protein
MVRQVGKRQEDCCRIVCSARETYPEACPVRHVGTHHSRGLTYERSNNILTSPTSAFSSGTTRLQHISTKRPSKREYECNSKVRLLRYAFTPRHSKVKPKENALKAPGRFPNPP